MSEIPSELRYTKSHEWLRQEDDGTVTVGVTDHAQEALGDLVFVELPEVGSTFAAEDACCVVESVKAASDVYMPVTGEVVLINDRLEEEPEIINSSPYDDGWLFSIKPENMDDLGELMDSSAYEQELDE